MKEFIESEFESVKEPLSAISAFIHENPELKFAEFKACETLIGFLEKEGFTVEREPGQLETAFKAVFEQKQGGPTVSYLAEYDALPEIGHGCGHNLIATIAVGAGTLLKRYLEKHNVPGKVVVLGTPAEEGGGGKILLINRGVFNDIDCAMMLHPMEKTMVQDYTLAHKTVVIDFLGRPAHAAASPEEGRNALEALIQTFNGINSLRGAVKDYTRIHGIITKGGTAINIITEHGQAKFSVRALDASYLETVIEKIKKIAEAAAEMTGTKVEISYEGLAYAPVKNCPTLMKLLEQNFSSLGETVHERKLSDGIGSTDMGNVTVTLPALHSYIGVRRGLICHTQEFTDACIGDEAESAIEKGVKALAMTGANIVETPTLIAEMKSRFSNGEASD